MNYLHSLQTRKIIMIIKTEMKLVKKKPRKKLITRKNPKMKYLKSLRMTKSVRSHTKRYISSGLVPHSLAAIPCLSEHYCFLQPPCTKMKVIRYKSCHKYININKIIINQYLITLSCQHIFEILQLKNYSGEATMPSMTKGGEEEESSASFKMKPVARDIKQKKCKKKRLLNISIFKSKSVVQQLKVNWKKNNIYIFVCTF